MLMEYQVLMVTLAKFRVIHDPFTTPAAVANKMKNIRTNGRDGNITNFCTYSIDDSYCKKGEFMSYLVVISAISDFE